MLKFVVNKKILLVEDDVDLAKSLIEYFSARENEVIHAETLYEAEAYVVRQPFDVIILDMKLPDGEGLELLRRNNNLPPVIILSILDAAYEILEGFSAGAVDYVVKPAAPEVLEARIALRLLPTEDAVLSLHGLKINATERSASFNGTPILLTGSEFNILWCLMQHAGSFFDAATLYERIWRMPSLQSTSIKYHISNLRRKLKAATSKDLIVSEFGKGYMFLSGGKDK